MAAALLLLSLPARSPAEPHTYVVTIDKMKFGSAPAQLHRGDVIVWDNRDIFRHSATADNGSFDVDLPAGKKVRFVVTKPGVISFFCKYHPGMRGTLRIAPK